MPIIMGAFLLKVLGGRVDWGSKKISFALKFRKGRG
jgi:hypothetical protein